MARAVRADGQLTISRANNSFWAKPSGRAKQGAALAASLPIYAFKIPEFLYGTGVHLKGQVDITTKEGLKTHVKQCYRSPCDTGLAGLGVGISVGSVAAIDAALGAAAGFVAAGLNAVGGNFLKIEDARAQLIDSSAAAGAMLGALFFTCSGPLILQLLCLNMIRTGLSAAKVIVCAPFAGIGYLAGGAVGLMAAVKDNLRFR